jgi:hypothetical protein
MKKVTFLSRPQLLLLTDSNDISEVPQLQDLFIYVKIQDIRCQGQVKINTSFHLYKHLMRYTIFHILNLHGGNRGLEGSPGEQGIPTWPSKFLPGIVIPS